MHVSHDEFQKFQDNSMNAEEMIAFLKHIDDCDYCLEQILNLERKSPIQSPAYMKEQILSKAATPAVQTGRAITAASYRMQLFCCGIRTAAGVLMALLLLFGISEVDFASLTPQSSIRMELPEEPSMPERRSNHLYDFSHNVNQGLTKGSKALTNYFNDFSNKIINGGK